MMRTAIEVTKAGGFDALALENTHLRAVIVPALGGRVWELEDRETGRQWIWRRPGVALAAQSPGAAYDEVWAGGWEELFPNDAPGRFEGRDLPDHGEWWTWSWTVAAAVDGRIHLTARASIVRASCEKVFVLEPGSRALQVEYRIRSEEAAPFHFLFKQHLPIAITPDCRLVIPGGLVQPVDAAFSTLVPVDRPFRWPLATVDGRRVDLRPVPPAAARLQDFLYVSDLPAPWCAVDDRAAKASIRMDYQAHRLPYLWLFLSYGGWRDTYTAVLEPCTNMPKDLADAVGRGQAARLGPGESFCTRVTVTLGRGEEP